MTAFIPFTPFTVADLRKEREETLQQFAAALGLKSKGQASKIEKGGRCSVSVALEIEQLSAGRIPAAQLNRNVAAVERARGLAA